ncbi:MAG: L-threonylcarbamoyladenylate synthase [Vulcanimicrobiaceae bacterium]
MRVLAAAALDEDALALEFASVVRAGGVAIFPTDTVYGIGCDPENETAVARIFALKGRPRDKPLALHFGERAALVAWLGEDRLARRLAEALLPGPLTLVVRRFSDASLASLRVTAAAAFETNSSTKRSLLERLSHHLCGQSTQPPLRPGTSPS